ncbi:MAG TPA: hypothetical protein VGB17_00350 [Pyrinomonadaceae bacterium]|jgi:hypothetical protein
MKKLLIVAAIIISAVNLAAAQSKTVEASARVEQKAMHGDSRLNVQFSLPDSGGEEESAGVVGKGFVRLRPSTTYLKNGLSMEEVLVLMGRPLSIHERREGDSRFTTYTFTRSGGRVFVAEFVNGVLVQSHTEKP